MFNYFSAPNNDESQELNKATFSTQFVKNLIERYVLNGDVVLDNFCGTGTTLVACIQKGIKAIGIEISPSQCKHTVGRITNGIQLAMF